MSWIKDIALRGWLPDGSPFELPDGGLVDAANVLSLEKAIVACPAMAQYNTEISGYGSFGTSTTKPVLKAQEFVHSNGSTYIFAGTQDALYRVNPNKSVDKVSTATYGASSWDFAQYGDWFIATDLVDDVQVLKDFASATYCTSLSGAPKAKYCLFDNGHLIMAHLTGEPKTVRWSAYENVESWTQTLTTGADKQLLADAIGNITGIKKYGYNFAVFFTGSIVNGKYSGDDYVFNFAVQEKKRGALDNNLILPVGSSMVYWDSGDLFHFSEGKSISICKYLRDNLFRDLAYSIDRSKLNECAAAYDQNRQLVMFRYTMLNGNSRMLFWNYEKNTFTYGSAWDSGLFTFHPAGNLNNAEQMAGFKMISNKWQMVSEQTSGYGLVDYGSMSITSKELVFDNTVMVINVRVNTQYKSGIAYPTVKVQSRMKTQSTLTDTTFVRNSTSGLYNGRATGKYHRVNLSGDAGILGSGINSIDIEVVERGERN